MVMTVPTGGGGAGLPFIPGANVLGSLLFNKNFGIPNGMSIGQYFQLRSKYAAAGGDVNDKNAFDTFVKNGGVMPTLNTANPFGNTNIFPNFRTTTPPVDPTGGTVPGLPSGIPPVLLDMLKIIPGLFPGSDNANNANPNSNSGINWQQILLPVLASIAGGLQNRSGKSTSTYSPSTDTVETSPTTTTQSTTPNLDPTTLDYRNQIIAKYQGLLNEDPNLQGYGANQLSQITSSANLQKQQLRERLASQGITGPALENAVANIDLNRFGESAKFKNTLPLLARDMREQSLQKAGQFFGTIPYGTTGTTATSGGKQITSRSGGTTTQETSGNILGGTFGGLTEMLAALYGIGTYGGGRVGG